MDSIRKQHCVFLTCIKFQQVSGVGGIFHLGGNKKNQTKISDQGLPWSETFVWFLFFL